MVTENSFKEVQNLVDKWILKHGGYWPPLSMICAIMEELGEVAREINYLEGYKQKKSHHSDSKLGEELADLIFSIICIANHYNIDLSKEFNKIIEKYSERNAKRFI